MKTSKIFISALFVLAAALVGCGGGGGDASAPVPGAAPGALDAGGSGLSLARAVNEQDETVNVNFSSALGVNDFNEIIGFAEITPGAHFTAALWMVNTAGSTSVTPAPLHPIAGNNFSAGFAIDEGGTVVGQSEKGLQLVAVIWHAGASAPTELPALTGTGDSGAYGISADGSLVVGEAQDATGRFRAVIWRADGAGQFSTPPQVLPFTVFAVGGESSTFSSASGVDRVGSAIWVVGEAENGIGIMRAALWRSADGTIFTATDLGLVGEAGSSAYAVNSNSHIVGEVETDAGNFVPVLWTADGLGGFSRTALAANGSAVAINENDRIAGWSGPSDLATVWSGTTPETLYSTASWAYGLNNNAQPLVVGRSGGMGFVKRVN